MLRGLLFFLLHMVEVSSSLATDAPDSLTWLLSGGRVDWKQWPSSLDHRVIEHLFDSVKSDAYSEDSDETRPPSMHCFDVTNLKATFALFHMPTALGYYTELIQIQGNHAVSIQGFSGFVQDLAKDSLTDFPVLRLAAGASGDGTQNVITEYHPQVTGKTVKYVPTQYVIWHMDTDFWPTEPCEMTVPLTVTTEQCNLRTKPEKDSTAFDPTEYNGGAFFDGNILAVYAKGSEGVGIHSVQDPTGRAWWLMVMRSHPIKSHAYERDTNLPIHLVGWVSEQCVQRSPAP